MDSVAYEGGIEDIRGGAIGEAARQAKAAALDDTRTWIDPRGRTLADRIWSAKASDRAAITQILREAIAAGEDPIKAARRLEVYLTPEGRRLRTTTPPIRRGTPEEYRSGKGSYAARRLARTEITRAHGQATIQAAAENEFVIGVRWNLSAAHPRVDICDELASRDRGLGRGVYPKNDVPRYPAHPHCLCNLSPVVAEDAIDRIVAQTRAAGGDGVADAGRVVVELPSGPQVLPPAAVPDWITTIEEIRSLDSKTGADIQRAGAVVRERVLSQVTPTQRQAGARLAELRAERDNLLMIDNSGLSYEDQQRRFLESRLLDNEIDRARAAYRLGDDAGPVLAKMDELSEIDRKLFGREIGVEERQELLARNRILRSEIDAALDAVADPLRTAVTQEVKAARRFGSTLEHTVTEDSDQRLVAALNQVAGDVPTDWWEASVASSRNKPVKVTYLQRAQYGPGDRPTIELNETAGTILHEFAHRTEDVIPDLARIEREFYERRTAGYPLEEVPGAKGEWGRFDRFHNPYMGKQYSMKAFELLSMGIQDAIGNRATPSWLLSDPDFAEFFLGLVVAG